MIVYSCAYNVILIIQVWIGRCSLLLTFQTKFLLNKTLRILYELRRTPHRFGQLPIRNFINSSISTIWEICNVKIKDSKIFMESTQRSRVWRIRATVNYQKAISISEFLASPKLFLFKWIGQNGALFKTCSENAAFYKQYRLKLANYGSTKINV